ncbi:SRPBCC family protein [Psychrobacillus sp. NPDC058041]|uniref:SRPBCC family protein n=1 Tax=Psychrobacillus sp. NPDC058041 TaxID=3346310 RepID=UPI0036DF54A4
MNNLTKMSILKPANEVFESFVDPLKIGNFWFTSSSERWEQGKAITLIYDEYNATVDIKVMEILENEKIVFKWGTPEDEHIVTISLKELNNNHTIIEVNEEGFKENDEELISKLIDNKEGWVYMLTCLKGFLEFGISDLRSGIVK